MKNNDKEYNGGNKNKKECNGQRETKNMGE